MIKTINPTSKASLKNQCLLIAQGDIKKAKELYDFYIDGLEELPAFDPIPPTTMEKIKSNVGEIMTWVQNNSGNIVQGVNFVRGLMGKAAIQTAAEVAEEVSIEE